MAIHSSVIRSLNQPESIYKNTQTSISLFPSAWGKATYVSGRLIVKPRVTSKHPGTGLCSRANILAKVPVPKARIGCKLIYIRCMPIILRWTPALDTLAGLAMSSDKMVTNLIYLARGFTVQQLPPAVYIDSMFLVVCLLCDIYYYMAYAKCY